MITPTENRATFARRVLAVLALFSISVNTEAHGVGPKTLRNWLMKYREAHGGTETELTVTERARLKVLERENHELRAETAFQKKATAYFAREQR